MKKMIRKVWIWYGMESDYYSRLHIKPRKRLAFQFRKSTGKRLFWQISKYEFAFWE